MLSDRTDLRNSSVSCTLKSYLFASLRCINDISLMNFPAVPLGGLLYVAMSRSALRRSLLFRWSARPLHCFNLVFLVLPTSVGELPFRLGLQRQETFSNLQTFFYFFSKLLKLLKNVCRSLFPLFQIPLSFFLFSFRRYLRSGLQRQETFPLSKTFFEVFSGLPVNR